MRYRCLHRQWSATENSGQYQKLPPGGEPGILGAVGGALLAYPLRH